MDFKRIKTVSITTTNESNFSIKPNSISVTLHRNADGEIFIKAEPKKNFAQVDMPIVCTIKVDGTFSSVNEYTPTEDIIEKVVNTCLMENKLKIKR
jgi:hypothetical protein